MQSVVYSRRVTRNLVSNVINECCNLLTNSNIFPNHLVNRLLNLRFLTSTTNHQTSNKKSSTTQHVQIPSLHLVTAYSGFSKDLTKPISKKGVIGDDAWFISSHKYADILGMFEKNKKNTHKK
jgi:hypothetical protein